MVEVVYPQKDSNPIVVELRDPYWAAFLAWIFPGLGHFYQGRYGKGFLFSICILGTFFFGLGIGRGRVVYASFEKQDFRWQYFCQAGTGAVAFPAIVQAIKTKDGGDPYFVLCERYTESNPSVRFRQVTEKTIAEGHGDPDDSVETYKDGFMAPPAGPIFQDDPDVLGMWHFEMQHMFEIGTLYCVIAGLLNFLAIYDAFCGPAILTPEQKEKMNSKKKKRRRGKEETVEA